MASRPSPNAEYSDVPQLTLHPSPADAPAARSAPADRSPAPADGAPKSLLDPGALLDPKPLIDHYLAIREIAARAQDAAVALLSTADLDACANKLDLFRSPRLLGMNDPRLQAMIDYAIYNHARGGRTAVQRYWQTHRPGAGSLEAVVRDAMLDTSYTLFRIVRVRPGVGVDVEAMLLDDSGLMVDINFSRSAVPDLVFAARLLRFDGFAISSGATLAPSAEALDDIIRDTDRLSDRAGSMSFEAFRREAHACIMRACFKNPAPVVFTHLDPEITPEEFHRLAQRREAALRAAGRNGPLALGSIDDDDDSLEWIPPLESTRRIGRNEPCPCGSGRKYKKCCGGGAASGIQSRTAL